MIYIKTRTFFTESNIALFIAVEGRTCPEVSCKLDISKNNHQFALCPINTRAQLVRRGSVYVAYGTDPVIIE